METLKKVGTFLRLLDQDGLISLTNMAVYIVLFKLASQQGDLLAPTDLGALLVAVGSYQAKRMINKK